MSNSSLVSYTKLSPHNSGKRTHKIDRITPHCVEGQLDIVTLCSLFSGREQRSCNYAIGKEGRVGLVVDEDKRSWCSSSNANDRRAVTIECASDKKTPYAFNQNVYDKLVELCVDICRRNGKNKLIWFGDKQTSISYEPKDNEMVLTVHRWFASKACPGDWLMARMGNLAEEVTFVLSDLGVYRLYNPNTGEHIFTTQVFEKCNLVKLGWNDEGIAFSSVRKFENVENGSVPVYRLYDGSSHLYTIENNEVSVLTKNGWKNEGVAFYAFSSGGNSRKPAYRLYNKKSGLHHWTVDVFESNVLQDIGWELEDVAFSVPK